MAQANKDFMARLADRGEQVVGRISDLPGAKAVLEGTTSLTKRIDEVQRRLRALDPLEKRVTTIEKRLDKLEGKGTAKKAPAKRRTTTRSSTAKRATKPKPRSGPSSAAPS